jgi:sec-independent protein translocase protein TatA
MLNIGPQELLLVLVVALLVVGPARLPELGRSIGKGLRELRKAQDEVRRSIQVSLDEPPTPARRRPERPAATGAPADDGPSPNGSNPEAAPASTTAAAVSEAVAAAQEAGPPVEGGDDTPAATEVARTLGRSLAELRRAREEIQRTFRVDVDGRSMSDGPARGPRAGPPTGPFDAPPTPEVTTDTPTSAPGETSGG